MKIKQKSFQEIKNYITDDVVESRIIARVFFVNNISSYYSLIDYLSEKADITINCLKSTPRICLNNLTCDMPQ